MDAAPEPALLLDLTRCPACFEPLRGTRCLHCGLDVSVEGGGEVYAASQAVVQAIRTRDRAIAAMRQRQLARDAAVAPAPPPPAPVPPTSVGPSTDGPSTDGPSTDGPSTVGPSTVGPSSDGPTPVGPSSDPPPAPRRSGVQILLLVAGVSAVSVAAVFFALVAVLLATPTIRAAILAVVGAGVLGGAVAMRRRLPATAEAVAVVGLVVLLLDLLLLRISDVAGLAGTDALVYTGVGLGVVAGAGALLGHRAGLRAGSFAAVFLLPAAALLVVAGLVDGTPATVIWAGTLAAAAAASLVGLATRRTEESAALRVQAALAAVGALAAGAAALGDAPLLRLVTEGAVVLVASIHLVVATRRRPLGVAIDRPAATAVGAAAAALGLLLALGSGERPIVGAIVLAPGALLVPLACAVALFRRLVSQGAPALAGLLASAVVGLPFLLPFPVAAGDALGALLVATAGPAFAADPGWATPVAAADLAAAVGLATAVTAVAGGAARAPRLILAAFLVLGIGALAVATASGSPGALLGTGVAVGGLAVAAMAALGRRWAVPATVLVGLGLAAITVAAPRSATLWPFAAAAGVVVLGAAVGVAGRGPRRVGSIAALTAFLIVAASLAVPWAAAAGWPALAAAPVASVPFVLAGVLLAAVGLTRGRVPEAERIAAGAVALLGGCWAGLALGAGAEPSAPAAAAIGLASAAIGAIAAVRHLEGASDVEPGLAAVLGPLLLLGAAASGASALPDAPTLLVPLGCALGVLASAALAVARVPRSAPARLAWRSSTAAAALAAIAAVVVSGSPQAWVPLVVVAAAGVVIAVGDPSRAIRVAAAWCAFALGAAALWQALVDGGVDAVEPYTLPPAVVLLATAAVAVVRRPGRPGRGRPAIAAAGLALALVPSAVVSWTSEGPRALIVALVSGMLVLLAARPPRILGGPAVGGTLLGVAAPVLAAVAWGQSVRASGGAVEAWSAPATVALLGAALLLVRGSRIRAACVPLAAGSVLAAAWAVLASDAAAATLRLPAPLLLLALVAVLLATWAPAALAGRLAAPPMVAAAIAVVVIVLLVRGDAPLETATAPLAAGLIGSGTIRMRRDPAVRSMPAIGPGLAVLLVPSLLLDLQPAVTWRVVALGIVALAVLVLGAVARLSAPFLIGGAVFVVHVLAQLQPWIAQVYVAVPLWAWIGAGGVLLIALAARYEHRVRDLRQAVRLLRTQR